MALLSLRKKRNLRQNQERKSSSWEETPDIMLTALLPFDKIPTLLFEFKNLTGRFLQIFPGGRFWEQIGKSPCCPRREDFPVQIASLLLVSTWLPRTRVLRHPLIYKLTSFALFSGLAVFPASLFSVYVIRCNLGLLCYCIFPQCFASMTHSAAFIPHVCASPKVFVSLSQTGSVEKHAFQKNNH